MEQLKLIFASNLIRLRQQLGLTQAALAEKINYSDKSVSKWERGEAIPDAFVLKQLAALFGITVDELLSDHSEWKSGEPDLSKKVEYSQKNIILTALVSIFTLCLSEFILVWMLVDRFHWIVLYAAIPLGLIFILVMQILWYKGRYTYFTVSLLVFSLILLIYLVSLHFQMNFWQMLILTIPAELIVFLAFNIKRRTRKKDAKAA